MRGRAVTFDLPNPAYKIARRHHHYIVSSVVNSRTYVLASTPNANRPRGRSRATASADNTASELAAVREPCFTEVHLQIHTRRNIKGINCVVFAATLTVDSDVTQ
jgi:hypothetical protein